MHKNPTASAALRRAVPTVRWYRLAPYSVGQIAHELINCLPEFGSARFTKAESGISQIYNSDLSARCAERPCGLWLQSQEPPRLFEDCGETFGGVGDQIVI